MNTITKIALAAVGTITAGVGLLSAPYIADSFNPNIVAVEMGGNWDCSAKTYRPDFGSKIAGELSTFSRHDGRAVARVMVNEFGLLGGMMGTAYIANEFASACESSAPVAQAPAPVAPPVVSAVTPAPIEMVSATRMNEVSWFAQAQGTTYQIHAPLYVGEGRVAIMGTGDTSYGTFSFNEGDDFFTVTTDAGNTIRIALG